MCVCAFSWNWSKHWRRSPSLTFSGLLRASLLFLLDWSSEFYRMCCCLEDLTLNTFFYSLDFSVLFCGKSPMSAVVPLWRCSVWYQRMQQDLVFVLSGVLHSLMLAVSDVCSFIYIILNSSMVVFLLFDDHTLLETWSNSQDLMVSSPIHLYDRSDFCISNTSWVNLSTFVLF